MIAFCNLKLDSAVQRRAATRAARVRASAVREAPGDAHGWEYQGMRMLAGIPDGLNRLKSGVSAIKFVVRSQETP